MSKITIFLCAVLFAATADATFLATRLAIAQQRVEAFVAAKIKNVQSIHEQALNRITDLVAKLDKAADDFSNKVAEDIKKIGDKIRADIRILIDGTKDVDLSACDKSNETVTRISDAVAANMTECINKKRETALQYIEDINLRVSKVETDLSAIRDEALLCGENVVGFGSTLRAIVCTKRAGLRGALTATRSIAGLTMNVSRTIKLFATLTPSLAFCTTTHGVSAFTRESFRIIRDTKTCIRQKVDEARLKPTVAPTLPPIDPTLPAIDAGLPALDDDLPAFDDDLPDDDADLPEFDADLPAFDADLPALDADLPAFDAGR